MPVVSTPMRNFPSKRPARASVRSQLKGIGNMGVILTQWRAPSSQFARSMFAKKLRGDPSCTNALEGVAAARRASASQHPLELREHLVRRALLHVVAAGHALAHGVARALGPDRE